MSPKQVAQCYKMDMWETVAFLDKIVLTGIVMIDAQKLASKRISKQLACITSAMG
jgi:hypothetical protein